MTQTISGVVTNLFTACRDTVYTATKGTDDLPVLVSLGPPGKHQPNAIVAIGMNLHLPITRPTLGPNRSREQQASVDCLLNVYVPGDEDAQATATAAALDLLSQLETYLRTAPNEKLSGACVDSWVSAAEVAAQVVYQKQQPAQDNPNPPDLPVGRAASINVTVSALIRY